MDHAAAVGEGDGLADPQKVVEAGGQIVLAFAYPVLLPGFTAEIDPLVEGLAFHPFHDQGRRAVRAGLEGVDGDHAGMGELGGDLGLAQWGIEKLRLSDGGPEYAIYTGRPIPDSWRSFDVNA